MTTANDSRFYKSLQFKMIFLSTFGLAILLLTLFVYVFPVYEARFLSQQKKALKESVDIAFGVIERYGGMAENKTISVEEAQKQAKDLLRPIRYNKSDYFFSYTLQGVSTLHPVNPDYEGTDRSQSKDARGKLNIKEMMEIAAGPGEGYSQYYAVKEKGGPSFPKMSYVKLYKPWGWFIATGVYMDVIEAEVRDFEMKVLLGFLGVTILVLTATLLYCRSLSKSIGKIVTTVDDLSGHVGQSVEELSKAGKGLSESSTLVASSLEETVASLEEVSATIRNNSDSAAQAATLSKASQNSAVTGEKEIKSLIQSMAEISDSSKKIAEITNVIDDIAFQTNLLALNAAVEAARAGDQGKGFAVVADAVRTLAQRSSVAAKDINDLIQDSVEKIEKGTVLADKSGNVLNQILESVNKVASINGEIASASKEQFTSIQQINKALNEIDRGTQTNAASAVGISENVVSIAGNSQEVDEQVKILRRMIAG